MPKRYILVLGMFLLSMLLYVDRVCIASAEEEVSGSLGLGTREMGWVFGAFSLGYALFQTPAGILADRCGPRILLVAAVSFWSAFTALTAAARGLWSLLIIRFLFGAGEAGAYPGCARAAFSWMPMAERGLVQGINFSGSRIGAALALVVLPGLIERLGWRASFLSLGAVGLVWAVFWWRWFRDRPESHPTISREELDRILAERQRPGTGAGEAAPLRIGSLASSGGLWLAMAQYFCSNFTFFFCLSWMPKYLREEHALTPERAGLYSAIVFLAGAAGQWCGGWLVDAIYRRGRWALSRRLPAMAGFALAASGLLAMLAMKDSAPAAVACLAAAIFGADMTISPSWSACIDIGRRHAGAVSGTMNMAGNLGSFATPVAFAYLLEWTGSNRSFFYTAAALDLLAIGIWCAIRPDRTVEEC